MEGASVQVVSRCRHLACSSLLTNSSRCPGERLKGCKETGRWWLWWGEQAREKRAATTRAFLPITRQHQHLPEPLEKGWESPRRLEDVLGRWRSCCGAGRGRVKKGSERPNSVDSPRARATTPPYHHLDIQDLPMQTYPFTSATLLSSHD
jgi:hypothetical protein